MHDSVYVGKIHDNVFVGLSTSLWTMISSNWWDFAFFLSWLQWGSQGLSGWATRPPGGQNEEENMNSLRKNMTSWSKFEEKMRKVEFLPTQDCEASYGPAWLVYKKACYMWNALGIIGSRYRGVLGLYLRGLETVLEVSRPAPNLLGLGLGRWYQSLTLGLKSRASGQDCPNVVYMYYENEIFLWIFIIWMET